MIFFLFVNLFNSSELIHKENLHPKIVIENDQIVYAEFIDDEFFNASDTSSSVTNKEDKSDLFYYVLGIIILIAAGFILKQRYEQYLKQRDNL
ncbi:MAG: hypothetical protein WBH40_12025 [Ignavibacteriaceae bacterium]